MKRSFPLLVFALLVSPLLSHPSLSQSIPEIVENVSRSVSMIVAYDITGSTISQGSGVFITKNGLILTNAHVLENAYSAEVVSSIGTFPHVTILLKDDLRDLALIRVSTKNALPVTFAHDTGFKPGQRVIAIGNPFGLEKTVSDGLISGIRSIKGRGELIQTTVPISPGSSGGVLLNSSGELIGVTTSTMEGGQNINFAISLTTIVPFLSEYDKNPLCANMSETLPPSEFRVEGGEGLGDEYPA